MDLAKLDNEARELLSNTAGRITPARLNVLKILLSSDSALSHQDIEQYAQQQGLRFDRVTLYRVLDWLTEQKVVHKVSSTDRNGRYSALRNASQEHAHFHCTECDRIFCLDDLRPVLQNSLPAEYQIEQAELHLQGFCPDCRS